MTSLSKLMSYWLRHNPDDIGITLDEEGWVDFDTFVGRAEISEETIRKVVEECDKQRFSIKDGKIRANQGHSVSLEMTFDEINPPYFLYHGTVDKYLSSIFKDGLKPMKRHHVHLSKDVTVAKDVGGRRGKPKILIIDANQMHEDGVKFYLSENGVYLVDKVEMKYLVGLV